jgi:hypothetical protein
MRRFWMMWLLVVLLGMTLLVGGSGVAQATTTTRGPLPVAYYPVPPQDNGWGMHFSPAAAPVEPEVLDLFTHELQQMGMKWVVILNDGLTPQQDDLVARLVGLQMEPILRIYTSYNDPLDPQALDGFVRHYRRLGVRYFQLYNEPNLKGHPGGWRDHEQISVEHMLDVWLPAARVVQAAGGIPTTPPLAPGGHYDDVAFLDAFLGGIQARGAEDVFYGEWDAATGQVVRYGAILNVHNYGVGHPPQYPDDVVSLTDRLVTAEELAEYGWQGGAVNVEEVNWWRSNHRDPAARTDRDVYHGNTLLQDSNGFRKLEATWLRFVQRFGFEAPVIGTEGGWTIGEQPDKRYLPVSPAIQATWTLEAYSCLLASGCVPDAVLAHSTWIIANYAANGVTLDFEAQALYRERCYTVTPPAYRQTGSVLPRCSDEMVVPAVWALVNNPQKGQTRPPRVARDPYAAARGVITPSGSPGSLMDLPAEVVALRETIPVADGQARLAPTQWETIRQTALDTGETPETILASLYPSQQVGQPVAFQYRVTSPSPIVQVTTNRNEVWLTNTLSQPVPIELQGQQYILAPRGTMVLLLPPLLEVVVPIGPSPTPTSTPRPVTTPMPGGGAASQYDLVEVYHFSCEENNQMTLLQVIVLDEQGQPLNGVPLDFNTMDGQNPAASLSGVKEPGMTEFALVSAGGGNWKVRVADNAGGSPWAENLRTDMWGNCLGGHEGNTWGHHSYRVTFQRRSGP